ncbi:MAG TPA: elongation factor P [Acidimicrobiia bacterium]|nr:elongation factor P [Acidimicrobiia bacterium]
MISTNDVKPGMTLDLDDGIFQIVEYQHVKPGKGRAFVKMKLKNIENGVVVERTFRADEKVPQAIVERTVHQYLFRDQVGFHFMDVAEYGQVTLDESQVGAAASYLKDGDQVNLAFHNGRLVGLDLPVSVELLVVESEPGVKGDRSSAGTKPARLETGLMVQVPLFVNEGDRIKVDTRTGAYMTRVS